MKIKQTTRKGRFGLFDKILFLHLISITLLFIFLILSYYQLQKNSFEKAFINKSELIRELLETACVDPVVNTIAYDRTGKIIKTLYRKNQEIAYIEIYDPTARIIASIGKAPALHLSIEEIGECFRENPPSNQPDHLNHGQTEFITSLSVEGNVLGVVRVGITKKLLQQQLKNSILCFLGIFIIAIAITNLIYFIFTKRWIIRPIINVSNIMQDHHHDTLESLSHRIRDFNKTISKDEIGTMSIAFEQMIQSISEHTKEKERAEKRLAAEHERLLVTLRSIGDGVITSDTDGRVVLLNKVAEHLTGWKQDEAAGKPVSEIFNIIDEKLCTPCENTVERILATGEIITLEQQTVLVDKNGIKRNIADSGAPIRDQENKIIGTVLVFRDVTDELHREKELQKVRKLESVGMLAAGIAHDFNNILVAVIGNLSLAREFVDRNNKSYTLINKAEKAALRAKELTQQLLTFAKGGDPALRETSLEELITESANFVLSGSNVACACNINDDLWAVNVDPGQINQVIQNLIINAKQAMPDGGTIGIDCSNIDGKKQLIPTDLEIGKYVRIEIRDNGTGMTPEVLEKIFDPYFTTKNDGNGLGLAVCHSIICKHKGNIYVESVPGQGTDFTIHLPATGSPLQKLETKKTTSLKKDSAKVMIMDDEEIIREVAQEILSYLGHDVVGVSDGAEAVRQYEESLKIGAPIDVIIMDLTIPGGMGGKEAVKKILAINAEAKVIVSSGYSNDPVMANFKEYGFTAMVPKPFNFDELGEVVNGVL